MPNVYSTGSWFPNLSPQIADFSSNLMRLKTHQADLDFRGRQLQQQGEQFNIGAYGTKTPAEGALTLGQQTLTATKDARTEAAKAAKEAQRFKEAKEPQNVEYGALAHSFLTGELTSMGVKKDNPIILKSDEMKKDERITNRDAYQRLSADYPFDRESILSEAADDFYNKQTKDPNYAERPEGKKQLAFIDLLQNDKTGEKVFGQYFAGTIRGMQQEEAAQKQNTLETWKVEQLRRLAAGEELPAGVLAAIGGEPKTPAGLSYHIEKEQLGNQKVQDYRVFVDKEGNVIKRVKIGEPYTNTEGVANVRIQAALAAPQQTALVDPITGQPLVFDKKTSTYRVAPVAGGGGIAPRPVHPSAAEREKTSGLETIKSQLGIIKETFNEHPEFVGVISGQWGRVSQLWTEDEAAFRQKILDVKDALLRARSGAQINEQEYKRLSKLVPDMGDSDTMFKGKMKSFEQSLDLMIGNRVEAQRKGGVYVEGVEGGTSPATATGLKIGDIQKGYRFKGGNPADKNSWVKVQ